VFFLCDAYFQIALVASVAAEANANATIAQRMPEKPPFQLKRKTPNINISVVAIQIAVVQIVFVLLSFISILCAVYVEGGLLA